MSLATLPRARYVTIGSAAEYLSVTDRTIRNYIARGDLTGYRVGSRAIRIDLRELEGLLTPIPTASGGGRR